MDTASQTDKSAWWGAYFIALVLLSIAGLIFGSHSPVTLLTSIFNAFGLVGLWGYLSDKAIGWRQFWVAYACLMFLSAAIGLGPGLLHGIRNDLGLFAILFIAAVFSLPQWWAVWRYAFRSPHIWQLPRAAA
jgi:hypothetical protein